VSGTRAAELGSGRNICGFPILCTTNDATYYRIFTFEKFLGFCERRDGTVQHVSQTSSIAIFSSKFPSAQGLGSWTGRLDS
jgi:hypothetical protein